MTWKTKIRKDNGFGMQAEDTLDVTGSGYMRGFGEGVRSGGTEPLLSQETSRPFHHFHLRESGLAPRWLRSSHHNLFVP